ncbi:TonB-dependent receptor [Paraglaciecola psychrophila]|uniref:TonB-dependent receptor plug n=1 Tax=Paraglaciecola psychrophila 170 TaxID=1129794 RepID=K6YSI7_9ALTE|nr:TonB-dependent receptor [Paraglaciecola psychrophila]AGH46183.1 TonB-dependent receptor plug [Paraglaciecola psychrophila 170]GAC35684.1 outer membrane insertion C-terminal signal protein [Paraglaciecola psychrophila 170]
MMKLSRSIKLALFGGAFTYLMPLDVLSQQAQVNIAIQPLGQALNQLSEQTGTVIIAPSRLVGDKQAVATTGKLSVIKAVEQLIKGSGLKAHKEPSGAIVIKKADTVSSSIKPVSGYQAPLDEVVVTGLKRESSLQDTPVAITVLGGNELKALGVTDFTDLIGNLSGISINSAYGGPENSFITIRGIGGADDYKPNGNPSVALHVNGIYQTSNAYLSMPLFDLERIEVLKGPQGTLYGRNTTAGTINAITHAPGDSLNGYADIEYGSYDFVSGSAAVGGPVSDDLGIRVAVLMKQGGGFMDGAGAGSFAGFVPEGAEGIVPPVADPGRREGFGDADLFAFRGTGVYDFDDVTSLTLHYFVSQNRGDTRQYDRVTFEDDNPSRNAGENSDPYEFYASEYYSHEIDVSGFSGDFSRQLNVNLNMDILFALQSSERNVSGNGDGTSFPRFQYNFDDKLDQTSLEIRLSDTTGGEFDWIAGAFMINDSVDFTSNWTSYAVLSQYSSPYNQRRNSVATFANVDWNISNDLIIAAGLRYTKDTAKFRGENIDSDPWGLSVFETTFKTKANFSWDREFDDSDLSGKLALQYFVNDNLNVFTSVSTAYRGGGFDGTSIFSEEETQPFESEQVLAYEAGARFVTDNINLTFDLFAYDFEELQATARLSNDTNGRTNVGEATVRGAEASLALTLYETNNHKVTFNTAGTYLDTEITEFSSNRVNDVTNTIGDPLPGSPEWSQTAVLNYQTSLANNAQLNARVNYSYHGEESNRLNAGEGNTAPSYSLLGVRVDLTLASGLNIYAYGRNITDQVYFLELNGGSRLVGAPATYGAGVSYAF